MRKYFFLFLVLFNVPQIYAQESDSTFYFFAFGDMPYFYPGDYERFENVINQLNRQSPAFSVHIGDIKSGVTPCSDDHFEKIKSYFDQFNHPLVYTPGDNEWTDCYKKEAGSYDPEERLEKLREVFFKDRLVFGKGELKVSTQRDVENYTDYIENVAWEKGNVMFGTVHVVGSNNNLLPQNENSQEEYQKRNAANEFWIREIFDRARKGNSLGVVIFMHAAMIYRDFDGNGFSPTISILKKELGNYDLPVLLIYGDAHRFLVDKPMRKNDGSLFTNFTAVQVFGSSDMHAVKITIDPDHTGLFQIDQEIIAGN